MTMMKLKCVVVADPKESVAQQTASQCDRLADQRVLTTSTAETIEKVETHMPELLVMSLELPGMEAIDLVPKLLKKSPTLFIVATYRELSVPTMERLSKLGVEDFVSQPVDIIQIYRAASRRFSVPFRRHDRYNATLEIYRADGVLIGKSLDISEGGLRMDAIHPVSVGESILVDLCLPDDADKRMRIRCQILNVDGEAPTAVTARLQFSKLWGPERERLRAYLGTLKPVTGAGPA